MRLSTAERAGKLIDKVHVFRKCSMLMYRKAEKCYPKFKPMTAKDVERIMSWYFGKLKDHIESMDTRTFILPYLGGIIYDEQRKRYLDWKREQKLKKNDEI